MDEIVLTDEMKNKLTQFKKVVEAILEDEQLNDKEFVEMVLTQGFKSMIGDILPKEEPTFLKEMANMFNENPQFVSEHIVNTLNRGKESESADQIRQKWSHYQ